MPTVYETVVLTDSPLGFWPLQETSGTSAADISGNSLTGTYMGTYTQNQAGPNANLPKAVAFAAAAGDVELGNPGALDLTAAWSIECWAFPTSDTAEGWFISDGFEGGSNSVLYAVGTNVPGVGAGKIGGGYYDNGSWRTIGAAYTTSNWYHVVLTYDGSQFILYLNGSVAAGPTGISALSRNDFTSPVGLGARPGVSPSGITGRLCYCAIYGTVLSSGRVAAHYAAAAAVVPVADFSATPLTGDATLPVAFTDLSTGPATSWSWDFGDGGTSTSQNPVHNYTVPGVYTVSLIATNGLGSDTETKTSYITVNAPPPAPTADFVGVPAGGFVPLNVSFTDLSTDTPTSWAWDFGDGGTSTLQNPTHNYTVSGTYTVELVATNAVGSDGEIKTDYIIVADPLPDQPDFSSPPLPRGFTPGFIPRKRYPMASTPSTITADLIGAGVEPDVARALGRGLGRSFFKQATDEYLNYRAIERSLGTGGTRWGTVVIGPEDSGADVTYSGDLGVDLNDAYAALLEINASGYGQIVILEGSYNGGTIPTLGGNVSIRGMGPTSTIITLAASGTYLSNVGSVEDLGFTGTAGSCLFGVQHVHNCNFFATGGDSGWFDVCIELCALVDNCYFVNLPGAVPQGVGAKGCQQVIGCIFAGFLNGVLADLTLSNTGYTVVGCTFLDCTIGVKITGQHFLISSNTFWIPTVAAPVACVQLTAASDHNYVVGNWDIEYGITDAGTANVIGPNASDGGGGGGGGSTDNIEFWMQGGYGVQPADMDTIIRRVADQEILEVFDGELGGTQPSILDLLLRVSGLEVGDTFPVVPVQQADYVSTVSNLSAQLAFISNTVQQPDIITITGQLSDLFLQVANVTTPVQQADFIALIARVATLELQSSLPPFDTTPVSQAQYVQDINDLQVLNWMGAL